MFLWQQHESLFLPCSQVPAMKSGHTLLVLATFPSNCPTKTSCSLPSIPAVTTRFRLHIATAAFRICQLLVPCTAPSRRVTSPMAAMLPSGWVYPWVPGVPRLTQASKLFRMAFSGHAGRDGEQSFRLEGPNIRRLPPAGLLRRQWRRRLVQHHQ